MLVSSSSPSDDGLFTLTSSSDRRSVSVCVCVREREREKSVSEECEMKLKREIHSDYLKKTSPSLQQPSILSVLLVHLTLPSELDLL